MPAQFGLTKIGGMQYGGVTIGEAMMNGQIVYRSIVRYAASDAGGGGAIPARLIYHPVATHAVLSAGVAGGSFRVRWSSTSPGSATFRVRVVLDGQVVAEGDDRPPSGVVADVTATIPDTALNAGSVLSFEAYTATASGGSLTYALWSWSLA